MEYGVPARRYSSAFGGVQTFPPREGTRRQESRKQKQNRWPGASWPPPALPSVSKRRRQRSVLCRPAKRVSERRGCDAPRSGERAKRRRGERGDRKVPDPLRARAWERRRRIRPQGIWGRGGCRSPGPGKSGGRERLRCGGARAGERFRFDSVPALYCGRDVSPRQRTGFTLNSSRESPDRQHSDK